MVPPRPYALDVGPCHYVTGRQRYRTRPSLAIPWENQVDAPAPHLYPEADSDHGSDVDDDHSHGYHTPVTQTPAAAAVTQDWLNQNVVDFQDAIDNQFIGGFNFVADLPDDVVANLSEVSDEFATDTDTNTTIGDDEDDAGDEFSDSGVPLIAPYRLNLTVLSQRYNIYAAAYRNAIHISRVRSCVDHSLSARPDLILKPPTSKEALKVGGYIDRNMPHQMNHLIMGDLGHEEVLLLACDDGDVLGYYTSQIETALLRLESDDAPREATIVKPFFHQNVGISAWGLAVHKQSRLIAVGNNKHEVHVFAFALHDINRPSQVTPELSCRRDLFVRLGRTGDGAVLNSSDIQGLDLRADIDAFLSGQRDRNYQIVVGSLGHNIPNVAFSDDSGGNVKVLAIDIRGSLWIIDIWSVYDPKVIYSLYAGYQGASVNRNPPSSLPRGWGVLVLPQSSFLPTSTFKDSLGLSPEEAVYVAGKYYGYYIETGKAVRNIKNNSTRHPWVRNNQSNLFQLAPHWHGLPGRRNWYDPGVDYDEQWHFVQDKAADDCLEHDPPFIARNPRVILPDGATVMRTYETDIEFVAGDMNTGIMLKDAILQKKPPRTMLPNLTFPPERLANLIHVPELSLVVAGSQCGRVALITLTRPENPRYSFQRGFKVDFVLPKTIDEDRRIRPTCLLLGVAIGPIFSSGGTNGEPLGNRRYRIMLHYYDHRILSYEVYRNAITDDLSVI
ncbi:hypothetical protein GGR55DRAFT_63825 [Xylaria sp. FL0064]|nr:hypothetical protein GGR55DRAFT_63825 [Xylaria sp. FL0064]